MTQSPQREEPVRFALAADVDAICDAFEAAWFAGQQPRIEDFVSRGDTSNREGLLRELLLSEWDLRRRQGLTLELPVYFGQFPKERHAIADWWQGWNDAQLRSVSIDRSDDSDLEADRAAFDEPGTFIDRYELREKLGEGGFGTVWAAEQRDPVKRRVAVKVIKLGMDTKQVVARFEAERQTLALMDHPNIAKVLDAGSTMTGRPYFVMELVHGIPITSFCDQQQLAIEDRLDLFVKVCGAVQHAHQKGIIHRDIKPSNVLVAMNDGVPIPNVIDFGIAKATQRELTEQTIFTQFQQFIGTPAYMSPEQAEMGGLDIDTRSDIYSLGVLLYELITGTTPFDAQQLMRSGPDGMRQIICREEPPRPSLRATSKAKSIETSAWGCIARHVEGSTALSPIDRDLDWIVMKCLEKDRARRYDTVNSLAMDVRRHLNHEPIVARPRSRTYLLRKLIQRNRKTVVSASILLLVLVSGIIGTTSGMLRAKQERRDAVAAKRAETLRAEGERRAKQEVQRRLAQVEKATDILAALLCDFDAGVAETEGETFDGLLLRRLSEAARQLDGDAVGDPIVVARLQYVLGISLRKRGHLQQAKDVLTKSLQTRQQLLGTDNLDTAAAKYELARVYREQADYALAEALLREVLAVRTTRLGPEHRDTLTCQHHLAMMYRSQGKYNLAEKLFRQVLAVRTARLGADDPDTLATQNGLALVLRSQGDFAQAEALFRQVLTLRTATLGANDLDTVTTKDDLAALYHTQGKYDSAEPLYKDALAVRTAKLGISHPDTLVSRHHLATLYQWQGRFALAEELSKEVLAERTARLGPDHPHTLTSLHDLARLYLWRKDYELSEALFKDVLARRSATLGADHLQTVNTKIELAMLYKAQAKFELAEPLLQTVVDVRTTQLSDNHPDTIVSQHYLAELYHQQHKDELAEKLYRDVLGVRTANWGADHPDTIFSRDTLAQFYWSTNQVEQSIPLLEESLRIQSAALEPDHPELLGRQVTLGTRYCEAGRFAQGIALIEQVRQKGRPDPDPAWVRSVLRTAYLQAGRSSDATALDHAAE